MAPYTAGIDFFQGVTTGSSWYEGLVTSHITAGILDDFFALLAVGLPGAEAVRVKEIYAADSHEALLAEQIRLGIAADPSLSSRLAMWGRRLVGDTMLVARSALASEAASAPDESRIEPVFTELIAAHTRRMDALGLTA
jgi:LPS sulfotransferase NodH